MLLQSGISAWEVWGVMLVLVSPLYAHAGYMMWKRWQTSQNTSDISDHSDEIAANSEEIHEMRETLVRIEYELQLIENDLRVLHDNVADGNHCASENCRWCECDEDGE